MAVRASLDGVTSRTSRPRPLPWGRTTAKEVSHAFLRTGDAPHVASALLGRGGLAGGLDSANNATVHGLCVLRGGRSVSE